MPLFVDEAWGPHFSFHSDFPLAAIQSGADAAVTSVHKILACFDQGAVLLTRGDLVDHARIAAAVKLTQTTSPSLPILASLDASRRRMALEGEELLSRALGTAALRREEASANPGASTRWDGERLGWRFADPTRLLIDVHGLGLTGFEVEAELRSGFGISLEMSDQASVIGIITTSDTCGDVDLLAAALHSISRAAVGRCAAGGPAGIAHRSMGRAVEPGVQAMSPRDAFFSPARPVPLHDADGQAAAELVVPYPPGIPVLLPGEIIQAAKVDYLQSCLDAGLTISGAADPRLRSVRVVAD